MTATAPSSGTTAEHARLAQATGRAEDDLFESNPWYEWGPYLSERAWGTVREDYSDSGDAWNYFPHDHARSRAYRWNEDGMAGLSNIHHGLCLALALWNGVDPILKERMARRLLRNRHGRPGTGSGRVLRRPGARRHRRRTHAGATAVVRGSDLEQTDVPVPRGPVVGRGSGSTAAT